MGSAAELLAEREKELACIYTLCLLAARAPEPAALAQGMGRALCSAMQHPAEVRCAVRFRHGERELEVEEIRGGPPSAARDGEAQRLRSELPEGASGGWEGSVLLEYRDGSRSFLPQERTLLESVMVVAASILRTEDLIAELRNAKAALESKNHALREVLSLMEEEKRRVVADFADRTKLELLPLAERARDPSLDGERRDAYLSLLAEELRRDLSRSGSAGAAASASLSPRERDVALQVRGGRTSKEIAALLGISEATVERHRHNIRRKLGLRGREINLSGYLGTERDL